MRASAPILCMYTGTDNLFTEFISKVFPPPFFFSSSFTSYLDFLLGFFFFFPPFFGFSSSFCWCIKIHMYLL